MDQMKLIQQLRGGQSREALQELYKGYPSVRHFIKTHGGNEDDAKDIFQESLLVFYRKVQQPDFRLTAAATTYLFSVAKYLWKDALKKKNREVAFEIQDILAEEDVMTARQQEREQRWLDQIIGNLGEKCAAILNLFYFRKKSMEEIAKELDYRNVDTAKTQKYKCLERAKTMAISMNMTAENQER